MPSTSSSPLEHELLEQKIEAVCRLAGGVAHDFNNLLTVIAGNASLLQGEEKGNGRGRAELTEILHAASRASVLTHQLLAFSRQQVLHPRPVDIRELLDAHREQLHRAAGLTISITTSMESDVGRVMADASQLVDVLRHLVSNARDAMPAGGEVRITAANVEVSESSEGYEVLMGSGPYVLLTVRDTGVGMDSATLARAFEPFFTTKHGQNRTGMGLATVYGIVKQSGGYVFVDSAPGRGTVARVYLPRLTVHVPTPVSVPPRVVARSGATETVLIAEDEDLVRAFTRRALERAGYRVYEAANGTDALQIARSLGTVLSLVLTDVVMPGLNGRQLATTLASELPHTAIVLMSGFVGEQAGGLPHHEWAFLRKPFTAEQLREAVQDALARRVSPAL